MSTDDLMRRAGAYEQMLLDATGFVEALRWPRRFAARLAAWFAGAAERHRERQQIRASARELLTFDDRMLLDIGMRRHDVELMLRRGRWPLEDE